MLYVGMTQSVIDCVNTCSSSDDHTDPYAGESAPGSQVDKPRKRCTLGTLRPLQVLR